MVQSLLQLAITEQRKVKPANVRKTSFDNQITFLYKCDNYYNKESEGGLAYNDPSLSIDWKIPSEDIIMSEKDRENPTLQNACFEFYLPS